MNVAWRFFVFGAATGMVLLLALRNQSRTWLVTGDSMAPRLLGVCWEHECSRCRHRFTTSASADGGQVCGNCGRQSDGPGRLLLPQRCVVQPLTRTANELRRFDLLAYRGQDGRPMVKRVVGLPGEEVSIEQGDLIVDGKRFCKSPGELMSQAILVSRWEPTKPQPTEQPDWQMFQRRVAGATEYRLEFNHTAKFQTIRRGQPCPLYDDYSHNVDVSRKLHAVTDYVVDLEFAAAARVSFDVDGLRPLSARPLPAGGANEARSSNCRQSQVLFRIGQSPSVGSRIRTGYWDGAYHFDLDGQMKSCEAPRTHVVGDTKAPFRMQVVLTSDADHCPIRRARVWRDLYYYSNDAEQNNADPWQLADDQWLVLGDNPPVSLDSRQTGPVPRRMVLGRVVGRTRRTP